MMTDKVKELEALKQKAAALEQEVAAERNRELALLPKQYGFENVDDFLEAVMVATGARPGRRRGRPAKARAGAGGSERRPRTTITDEMRAQVKKLVEQGKTGAQIAEIVDISLPSVQNIKKALGLVRSRR